MNKKVCWEDACLGWSEWLCKRMAVSTLHKRGSGYSFLLLVPADWGPPRSLANQQPSTLTQVSQSHQARQGYWDLWRRPALGVPLGMSPSHSPTLSRLEQASWWLLPKGDQKMRKLMGQLLYLPREFPMWLSVTLWTDSGAGEVGSILYKDSR